MEHEDVSQAVVMVREDTPGDKRLVAYLILQGAGARTTTEWRQHLKRTLPDYMVPSSFIVLDELPLTPNGKIDRKALPAPDGERPDLEQKFSEPRTALQLQLVHLWEEILSVRPIGITDNFFDLGGHSLLAKRLLLRVETQVKQTVPLTLFFQEPTIKALAATLEANGVSRAQEPLVAIQPHGTRRPFFCVHSVGGDVIRFYHLARCLGDDQPFYGFQAPHPSELTSAKETIEELAERYISAMRLKQPQGPYLLGGYSFGSIVAYEMAQQLKSSGERIGLLALFDGVSPLVQQRARERSDGAVLAGFARDLARSAGVDLSLPHEQIEQLGDGAVSYIVEQLNNFGLVPNGIGEDYFRRFVLGLRVRTNAVRAYRARKYEGELTLFRCMEVEKESSLAWQKAGIDMSDKTRGWDELADGGLSIEFVPGHHATMMSEPHVRVLAEKLRNCMERAESAI
jgi:thioesterase domain-containing protein